MTDLTTDILLIGGGVASASAALELRDGGFAGSVSLVTREFDAPYHRPPITKALLRADADQQPGEVLPVGWWTDNEVQLITRSAVTELDLGTRTATLASKKVVRYGQALIATGATVRRLNIDGASLTGIHYLRTAANATKLRQEAATADRVVLVGGSFVAVEVAAQLADQGLACTLVMQERQCLERVFGKTVAAYVTGLLHEHGVRTVCGAEVVAFKGEGRVTGVRTGDGRRIDCDLVVVGAGAVPDTKLGVRAGLETGASGGFLCDTRLRTSDPNVLAAGDVCEYESVVHGRTLRVEHEAHAAAQGVTAARNMLGAETAHVEVPYFWSEIADWVKLESVGPAPDWDEEVVSGSVPDGAFTVWYSASGRLVGAVTAGRPQDLAVARARIASGGPPQPVLPG